jgi:hypothetical protein
VRSPSIQSLALLLFVSFLLACGGGSEPATDQSAASRQESAPPPPPPPRRTLPNAEPAAPATLTLDRLSKVDLAGGLTSGETKIEANDERFQSSITVLVDGDPDSMAISAGTNPLDVTVTLPAAVRLRAARVQVVGSHYDWVVEPVPGEGRLRLENVPERTWSQIDLPQAVETSVIRFEFLRLERDDYVHIGEIELHSEP